MSGAERSNERSKARRRILIKFCFFSFGIFLAFAGYGSLLDLQSSINIEDGVGATSVTAAYVTSAMFGITITPVILTKLRPKICILIFESLYVLFILANYYPVAYTLIPAGVVVGFAESIAFPAIMLFCVHYATSFAQLGSRPVQEYITEFIGKAYFSYQCSGIFGSLVNYGILNSGTNSTKQQNNNDTTQVPVSEIDLSVCGKNDCQDPNITNQNINNYVPASKTLLYILIGVMAGLVLIAMLIHIFLIKSFDPANDIIQQPESKLDQLNQEVNSIQTESRSIETESTLHSIYSTIKKTFLHLICPKQLLLAPFALYCGLLVGFGLLELPRAFGSCVLGIEKLGLLEAMKCSVAAVMSLVSTKISSRFGRTCALVMGFVLDIGKSMIYLFWLPTQSTTWVVYILFAIFGTVDGIWQPLVNEMHSSYFPEKQAIAFSVWNLLVLVGIAWQTGWSTSLCVYTKIYFQIGMLCFSVICYVISQLLFYRKQPKASENENNEASTTMM